MAQQDAGGTPLEPAARESVPPDGCSISFVCEPGRLEAQAVLLAASLREAWPGLQLVAAVPRALPDATRRSLDALGVAQLSISNPLAADYPIGNKIAALGVGAGAALRVFLDTDVLCLRRWSWPALTSHALAAKPADFATFGREAVWRHLYRRFDLAVPDHRVLATVSQELMYPYFNAGMLATRVAAELAPVWAQTCAAIDTMQDVNPRRPWLDQIGLPVAAARLGLSVRSLGEAWNYPAHVKPVRGQPAIVHYHVPAAVAREPVLVVRVAQLLSRHPLAAAVVHADAAWQPVVQAIERRRPEPRRRWFQFAGTKAAPRPRTAACTPPHDLIVTGIPRSGTSYVCKTLDGYANAAVINEPGVLFKGLRLAAEPWSVPLLYADLRARIDAGEAVPNKLDGNGALTDDTAVAETLAAYRPALVDAQWILATKNTLAYMARLEGLLRVMPRARVVACIRHPLDTLASWKGTFAHLAKGEPGDLPVGGLADPFLPARLRDGLQALARLESPAMRRAAWWALLANELLLWRPHVEIVRYEDLVADPAAGMRRVLGPLAAAAGAAPASLEPSAVRTRRRQALDADDWRAVATLCAGVAEAFGYDLGAEPEGVA